MENKRTEYQTVLLKLKFLTVLNDTTRLYQLDVLMYNWNNRAALSHSDLSEHHSCLSMKSHSYFKKENKKLQEGKRG